MDLKELEEMAKKDTTISEDNISEFSLSLPAVTTKWLRLLSEERVLYEALEIELAIKRKERGHYYRYESEYKFKDKAHYDELMKGDTIINKVQAKLVLSRESINFIEGVIKNLNATSFNIKNFIEWKKFSSGGY